MLPFSLASGKLNSTDGKEQEFSVLELSAKGILLRVTNDVRPEKVTELQLYLRLPFRKEDKNAVLTLKEWHLTLQGAGQYFQTLYAAVSDPEYSRAVRDFSGAYLEYVDAKLNLEEAELAQKYTGYPAEQEESFSTDFMQWKKKMLLTVLPEGDAGNKWLRAVQQIPERMVCLNTQNRCSQFLTLDFSDFIKAYWEETGLQTGTAGKIQINGVVFGSETCRHLVPEFAELEQLTLQARRAGLKPVLAFPAMKAEETESRKLLLNQLSVADPAERPDEIVINDLGTAALINELSGHPFRLRLGILMNRHTKDPRQIYRAKAAEPERNLLNALFYLEYLKDQFHISAFSAEAWPGCALPAGDTALTLPYIQTNTGGHCPLRALCVTGDRGNPGEAKTCPGFCEKSAVLYPDFLRTVGVQNSVYTLSTAALESEEELKNAAGETTTRLVFNFF